MSFIVNVNLVKTDDLEDFELFLGDHPFFLSHVSAGPFVLAWNRDFTPDPNKHSLALEASKRWGEAFYWGTDSVADFFSFAHYVKGKPVRTIYFCEPNAPEGAWEESGNPEEWEKKLGLPAKWSKGSEKPSGDSLAWELFKHFGCLEPKPPQKISPEQSKEELTSIFCNPRISSSFRKQALEIIFSGFPNLPGELRDSGKLPLRSIPDSYEKWERLGEDFRIIRSLSINIKTIFDWLNLPENEFEDDEEKADSRGIAVEMAEILKRYDLKNQPLLEEALRRIESVVEESESKELERLEAEDRETLNKPCGQGERRNREMIEEETKPNQIDPATEALLNPKSNCSVIFDFCGPKRQSAIRVLWAVCGQGEEYALSVVDKAGVTIKSGLNRTLAESIVRRLQEVGASARIVET